jgi:hypothetical protein
LTQQSGSQKRTAPWGAAYASLRAALHDDPIYIAEQGGWRDAGSVFATYQRAAERRENLSGRYLEQFDAAREWAQRGTNGDSGLTVPEPASFWQSRKAR